MIDKTKQEKLLKYIDKLREEAGLFDFEKSACYLPLRFLPESIEMKSLIDGIWGQIQLRNLNKNKDDSKFKHALGVICSELLIAQAHNDEGWAYRSRKRDSFTDEMIGESSFRNVLGALEEFDYIEQTAFRNRFDDSKARRVRLTPSFLALAEKHGVKIGNLAHFWEADQPPKPFFPIFLRASCAYEEGKAPGERGPKVRGELMRVHRSNLLVKTYVSEINEINEFLSGFSLTYPGDPEGENCCEGFRRIFSCGDTPDHNYQKGGRLYPIKGGYQGYAGRPPEDPSDRERKNLLINGEPVAEIDIGGCHARILMAAVSQPIGEEVDPYKIEGVDRDIAKLWFTQTMGHNKLHRDWSDTNKELYTTKLRKRKILADDYCFKTIQSKILDKYPFLKKWAKCPVRWGDLHYIESCIIVKTMLRLAREHGIPAYPVHDSIIVPVSKAKVAEQVLRDVFKEEVGVYPALSVKGA